METITPNPRWMLDNLLNNSIQVTINLRCNKLIFIESHVMMDYRTMPKDPIAIALV